MLRRTSRLEKLLKKLPNGGFEETGIPIWEILIVTLRSAHCQLNLRLLTNWKHFTAKNWLPSKLSFFFIKNKRNTKQGIYHVWLIWDLLKHFLGAPSCSAFVYIRQILGRIWENLSDFLFQLEISVCAQAQGGLLAQLLSCDWRIPNLLISHPTSPNEAFKPEANHQQSFLLVWWWF